MFGVETDVQFSGADDRFAPWKFTNPWFGTLRGRAGYAMNNILFYGTVGLAYGTLSAQNTVTGVAESPPTSAGRRRRRGSRADRQLVRQSANTSTSI